MTRRFLVVAAAVAAGLGLAGVGIMVLWSALPRSAETARAVGISDPRLVSQYDYAGCTPGRVDPNGVAMVDYGGEIGRQYNPVTIAQTAIGCYHNFLRDKDPKERKILLDQIDWLKHNWVPVGNDGAAYQYHFAWSYGLKPGWRSGLAQGQAISALIRYYYLSGDGSVLPLIKRLKNYMLVPTDRGGLVATSRQGGMWIEEFPSSPPSFVLNGFMSATFGLYEFTKLFAHDKAAQDELERAIASIRLSLPGYDTGNWMYLDRKSPPYPKASNGYAIGYIYQTRTLWQIAGDPLFLATHLRWQSFYHDANYHKGGNMTADPDGRYRLVPALLPTALPDGLRNNYELVGASPSLPNFGVEQLFQGDKTTDPMEYYAAASTGPAQLHFRLKHAVEANALTITLYNGELYPEDLHLFVKPEGKGGFEELAYRRAADRNRISYYFEPRRIRELYLVATRFHGQRRLVIAGLGLGMAGLRRALPEFGSLVTGPVPLDSAEFAIGLDAPPASRGEIFVLYRHADTMAGLERAPWVWDYLDPFAHGERPVEDKFYQFDVLTTAAAGQRGWSRFRVVGRGPAPVDGKPAVADGTPGLVDKAFAGQPITVRFDPQACTDFDLGTIQCGSDYTARYGAEANRWTVTGYSLGTRAPASVVSENASGKPGQIGIWGLIARFDDTGDLYFSNEKVGRVALGRPAEAASPRPNLVRP